jgi:hypothetical protein
LELLLSAPELEGILAAQAEKADAIYRAEPNLIFEELEEPMPYG